MDGADRYVRDKQQPATLAIDTAIVPSLDVLEMPDGWSMVSFPSEIGALNPPTPNGSRQSGSMLSSTSDMSTTTAMPQGGEQHHALPGESDYSLALPNAPPRRELAAYYAPLAQLRDERLLAQTKADNLRHKHEACCMFLDNDIGELSDALSHTWHETANGGQVRGLASRFAEDTHRYQRQLTAVRAAEAELIDVEQRIFNCEVELFKQLEVLSHKNARDP